MKRDDLLAALKTDWQSVESLMAATGWQHHTLRGAISTMAKKNGFTVERRRVDGVTSYRIADNAEAT